MYRGLDGVAQASEPYVGRAWIHGAGQLVAFDVPLRSQNGHHVAMVIAAAFSVRLNVAIPYPACMIAFVRVGCFTAHCESNLLLK